MKWLVVIDWQGKSVSLLFSLVLAVFCWYYSICCVFYSGSHGSGLGRN
jgi:hypothetical protein